MENIVNVEQSYICVLDSRNCTRYNNGSWNSSVVFDFEEPIVHKSDSIMFTCCVLSFTCPNSIYIINELNNILSINSIIYSIPYGNYNAITFTNYLLNILPSTFSMSLNPINNKFTISNTTDFIINSCNIYQVMGFSQNLSFTSINQTLTLPYPCNFNGIQSFNINFENLNTENVDSFSKSNSSIIQSIPIDCTSQQISFNKTNSFSFLIKQDVINYINVEIRDDLENLINLNSQHWNLTL
jgi:hypothetical protein